MLEPGARLGQYEIQRHLARGETSTVYLARYLPEDGLVAVKLLDRGRRQGGTLPELLDRRDIDHPNIVRLVAVVFDSAQPYVVMEYVDGETLAALIERRSAVPLLDKLRWLEDLSAAVAYLHGRGYLHGRITPERVMIGPRGHLKLLGSDLIGAAGGVSDDRDVQTLNVRYRAPEQIRLGRATPGGDLFSIGALAYELLTYTPAFPGDSPDFVRNGVLSESPVPPPEARRDLPAELIDLIDRALRKAPETRLESAETFRAAISRIRMSLDVSEMEIRKAPLPAAQPLDEVQFTVYRPAALRPDERNRLLVFMHLASRRRDAPAGEPDPIAQVATLAGNALGKEAPSFGHTTADGRAGVPPEGEITLVPVVKGLEFEPERLSFRWAGEVHQEEFGVRARPATESYIARGQLTAFLGVMLLAEVDISIRVNPSLPPNRERDTDESSTARAYRRIFASYSRRDREIVRQFELFVETLGDRYLIDVRDLPAGGDWKQGLRALIEHADVFQLFWSHNAMTSAHVRDEWEYALSLNRPAFVRPTYWEDPLPESPSGDLPPERLRRLHFHRLSWPGATGAQGGPAAKPTPEEIRARVENDRREAAVRARVNEALEQARTMVRAGHLDAALACLEALEPVGASEETKAHALRELVRTEEARRLEEARRRRDEEEARHREQEARRQAEEAQRQRAEEEVRQREYEERRRRDEEEARHREQEARQAEEAARQRLAEEARQRELEARRRAEAEARQRAEEERRHEYERARQQAEREERDRAERALSERNAAEVHREALRLEAERRRLDELLAAEPARSSSEAASSLAIPPGKPGEIAGAGPRPRVGWYVAAAVAAVAAILAWILLL
jgi:hypothetical protein